MRTPILPVSFLLFATQALAAGSVPTPSLDGWTVTGADQNLVTQSKILTIPSGTQVARSVLAGDVTVNLVTQPTIGSGVQDWPVLELGSTSVVFSRGGDAGQLLLVIGDNAPVALLGTFALDADGQSTAPVALTLTEKAGTVTLNASGQSLQLPTGKIGVSEEVVLSAGANLAWSITTLKVSTPTAAMDEGKDQGSSGNGSQGDAKAAKIALIGQSALEGGAGSGDASTSANSGAKPPGATAGPTRGLEVFTPPSVRLGRVDVVRAALAKNQSN